MSVQSASEDFITEVLACTFAIAFVRIVLEKSSAFAVAFARSLILAAWTFRLPCDSLTLIFNI